MRWMTGFVLCALAVSSGAESAQRETMTISGTVRTIGGAEAGGTVYVRLESSGAPLQEQFTSNGRFEFAVASPGWYTVAVRALEFEDVDAPVMAPAEDLVITLRPKSIDSANPAAVSVFDRQIPESARQHFQSARTALRKNDCAGAVRSLRQAIEIFAEYAEAHNEIGNCYVKTGAASLAEESFREALKFTSAVYPALNLADLYATEGRFREADDVLTKAIRRSPAEGNGYYGLAVLRFRQDRFKDAEQLAHQAHNRKPHIADVHLLLAKVYQREANQELVLRQLELYVKEAKPGDARSRAQQAIVEFKRRSSGR